jgi:hypothetical protein
MHRDYTYLFYIYVLHQFAWWIPKLQIQTANVATSQHSHSQTHQASVLNDLASKQVPHTLITNSWSVAVLYDKIYGGWKCTACANLASHREFEMLKFVSVSGVDPLYYPTGTIFLEAGKRLPRNIVILVSYSYIRPNSQNVNKSHDCTITACDTNI